MNVLLFGATGMVGHGVLIECLEDPDVKRVVSVVRRSSGKTHAKLEEIVHSDFNDFTAIEDRLRDVDACFFCLGISSAGMKEDEYKRITYDITLAAARTLKKVKPDVVFIYVSGAGTDTSEKGRSMWARVKGKTENDLLAMFDHAYMFRPGYIQPVKGVASATKLYRAVYAVFSPLYPLVKKLAPNQVTTTEILGRSMIAIARKKPEKHVVNVAEINALGQQA
jgi:uncharacterized protein YbjT (DUF2867 family)